MLESIPMYWSTFFARVRKFTNGLLSVLFMVTRKTKDAAGKRISRKRPLANHTATMAIFNHISSIVSHRLVFGVAIPVAR